MFDATPSCGAESALSLWILVSEIRHLPLGSEVVSFPFPFFFLSVPYSFCISLLLPPFFFFPLLLPPLIYVPTFSCSSFSSCFPRQHSCTPSSPWLPVRAGEECDTDIHALKVCTICQRVFQQLEPFCTLQTLIWCKQYFNVPATNLT
jgi:hypothetical protein